MTELLDKAVRAASALPPEAQDDLARMMLLAAGENLDGIYELTSEDITAVERSRAAAARGDFASDERMRVMWAKVGL